MAGTSEHQQAASWRPSWHEWGWKLSWRTDGTTAMYPLLSCLKKKRGSKMIYVDVRGGDEMRLDTHMRWSQIADMLVKHECSTGSTGMEWEIQVRRKKGVRVGSNDRWHCLNIHESYQCRQRPDSSGFKQHPQTGNTMFQWFLRSSFLMSH